VQPGAFSHLKLSHRPPLAVQCYCSAPQPPKINNPSSSSRPDQHTDPPSNHLPYHPSAVVGTLRAAAVLADSTCPAAGLAAHTVPVPEAVHIDLAAAHIDPVAAHTGPVAGMGWGTSHNSRWVGDLGGCSRVGHRRVLGLHHSELVAGTVGTWAVRPGARPT
jgi:hypothetical protein